MRAPGGLPRVLLAGHAPASPVSPEDQAESHGEPGSLDALHARADVPADADGDSTATAFIHAAPAELRPHAQCRPSAAPGISFFFFSSELPKTSGGYGGRRGDAGHFDDYDEMDMSPGYEPRGEYRY